MHRSNPLFRIRKNKKNQQRVRTIHTHSHTINSYGVRREWSAIIESNGWWISHKIIDVIKVDAIKLLSFFSFNNIDFYGLSFLTVCNKYEICCWFFFFFSSFPYPVRIFIAHTHSSVITQRPLQLFVTQFTLHSLLSTVELHLFYTFIWIYYILSCILYRLLMISFYFQTV